LIEIARQGLIKTYEEEDHEPWGACPSMGLVWLGEVLLNFDEFR
jgi:hypothetical protein